jgi:hypothetical protein
VTGFVTGVVTGSLPLIVMLQTTKGSAGIAGVPPVLLPDVPVGMVLLVAALNPITIAIAWQMGKRADAPAKLLVAGFAAATAGAIALWLGTMLRLSFLATPARAAAGIFVAGIGFGMLYAWLAYRGARRTPRI